MNNDLNRLANDIWQVSHIEGDFTLRSERKTKEYFDKYQIEADPALLDRVVSVLAPLVPTDTEVLAGLEMGGIPVATMLAQKVGLPTAFVRKNAKPYGTARLSEGVSVAGKTTLIVEDVVTSGGQIALSAADLRELGANVSTAICIIDRGEGGTEKLREHDIELLSLLNRSHFANVSPSPE